MRKGHGLMQKGDKVVLTAGVPLGVSGNTNRIRIIEVENEKIYHGVGSGNDKLPLHSF